MSRTPTSLGAPQILAGQRTATGRHWGSLAGIRSDDLAANSIRGAVDRSGVDDNAVDEVNTEIVNASGEAMGNVARFSSLLAGLPSRSAGLSMNCYCESGLSAFISLTHAVGFGSTRAGVAVGVEVMSGSTWPAAVPAGERYPGALAARHAMRSGEGGPKPLQLEANGTMIEIPEAVRATARKYGTFRGAMDESALRSQQRTGNAWDQGRLADEVVAVATDAVEITSDETFWRESALEGIGRLRGYFPGCPDGTADDSSSVSDGARALFAADAATARHFDPEPLGEVVAAAIAGVAPADYAVGPVPATRKLRARAERSLDDVGLIEINEAFAAQTLACVRELDLDESLQREGGSHCEGPRARKLGHANSHTTGARHASSVHSIRNRVDVCRGGMGVAVLIGNPAA